MRGSLAGALWRWEYASPFAAIAENKGRKLDRIPLLSINQETVALARALVEKGPIPQKAGVDAVHIDIATTNGMDYLLSWNCKHIANAEMLTSIAKISREA